MGPTLINAITYRWEGHVIGDAQPYRSREEVEEWKKKSVIHRPLRALAGGARTFSPRRQCRQVEDSARKEVEEAVSYR